MPSKEVQKEILGHFLVSLIWVMILSLLRWSLGWKLIYLWAGVALGTFILDIDHLIYWFVSHSEKQDSQLAKILWQKQDFPGLLSLLARYHDTHTRLIFHSALFQGILFVLAFYIFTSGGSFFASGLVAAMNLHLLKDEWQEYLRGKEGHLNDWLFWQVQKEVNLRTQKIYLISVSAIFGILSLMV